ncbi:MAG TPA: hypothetical protein VLW85_26040 [Myxococcales bacterium]|nr:hypothetical protein [Myxococcales bacterium]
MRTALLLLALAGAARAEVSLPDDADASISIRDNGPTLKLYGFADASYDRYLYGSSSAWAYSFPPNGAFAVGNLNLFLDGQLSPRARSLIEIRYSYLQGGQAGLVNDYTLSNSKTPWGGIVIERAWVEYAFSDLFTVRAGQFLTPYGVWNVDHGSVTLIDVFPPYVITQQIFPSAQQGVEIYGSHQLGKIRAGYHATVSTGRMQSATNDWVGGNEPYASNDHRLAYGGHAFVESNYLGVFKAGVSAYTGRYTEGTQQGPTFQMIQQYDELALGLDVKWEYKGFLAVYEALRQGVKFTDAGRAAFAATLGVPTYSDYTSSGWYLLTGYRLPWLGIMPFAMVQRHSPNDTKPWQSLLAATFGLNVRLLPNLVLKASVTKPFWPDATDANLPYSQSLLVTGAQVAWAF